MRQPFNTHFRLTMITIISALVVSAILASVDGHIRLSKLEVKEISSSASLNEIRSDIRSIKRYLLTDDKKYLE